MGWLGDFFGNIDDGLLQPINNNILPGVEDTARNEAGFMDDLANFDFEGMKDRTGKWEDIGNQMFGTGGWYKAAASYWLGPFADALAKNIENEGDAEQAWTHAIGNYAGTQAAASIADYASGGTSDYSVTTGDEYLKKYPGDSTTAAVSPQGDYSLGGSNAGLGNNTGTAGYGGATSAGNYSLADVGKAGTNGAGYGFQGNTYQAPGSPIQNAWANYKVGNPITANAVEGAVKGGVKAGISGGNIGMGAVVGGLRQGGSAASNLPSLFSDTVNAPQTGTGAYTDENGEVQHSTDIQQGTNMSDVNSGSGDAWDNFSNVVGKYFGGGGGKTGQGRTVPINWGDAAAGLMGMYNSNRAIRGYQGQINNLSSLFTPDSPYAQQLKQQLARKDAASGRRSQYGPREVELMARLAEMNSRNAPSLLNLQAGINRARTDQMRSLVTGLNNVGAFDAAGRGLQSLYNNWNYGNPYGDTLMSGGGVEPGFFDGFGEG